MTTLAFRGRIPCFAIPEIHLVHFLKEEGLLYEPFLVCGNIPVEVDAVTESGGYHLGKRGLAALPGASQQNHALL